MEMRARIVIGEVFGTLDDDDDDGAALVGIDDRSYSSEGLEK